MQPRGHRLQIVRPSPLVSLLLLCSGGSWLGWGLALAQAAAGALTVPTLIGLGLMLPGDLFVTWLTLARYRRQVRQARARR